MPSKRFIGLTKGDSNYLIDLDSEIYSLQSTSSNEPVVDPSLLLLSAALRILDVKDKRLDSVGVNGDILAYIEFNNIYCRRVLRPSELEYGDYPLLLLFNAVDSTPYLLVREGIQNRLLTIQDGKICKLPRSLWPEFKDNAYELHASFRDKASGIAEVLRLAYKPELKAIALLLLISCFVLAFSLSIPLLTSALVSTVLPEANLAFLAECLIVVGLIVVVSITSQYLQEMMILRLETIGNQRLQFGMWEFFLKLPVSFADNRRSGDIYAGVSAISKIRTYVGAGSLKSGLSALFSVAFLVLMFQYNQILAFWSVVLVVVVLLVVFQIARRAIRLNQEVFDIKSSLNGISDELGSSVFDIRSINAEIPFLRRWMHDFTSMAKISMQLDFHNQCIDVILTSLSPLGSVLLFYVAVMQILNEPDSINDPRLVGSFIAFYSAFIAFSSSIADVATNFTDVFANVSVLWRKARVVLDANIEPGWKVNVANHSFRGSIKFNEVNIQPDGLRKPLLQNISLDISPGKILAIVGKKAAGKSLLLKSIVGLVVPRSGEVLIDGIPIQKVSARGLRRQVGYIRQEMLLEDISIRDLLCGIHNYPDSLLWETLELLGLEERIRALPQQLDSVLCDGGDPLSRGERKLLALARCLLRKPAALLLDELLVGLSAKYHSKLIDLIQAQNCTVVMIPSFWAELKIVDHLLVLDDGVIRFTGRADDPCLDKTCIDLQ